MTRPGAPRVTVDGKFFRLSGRKFYVKGVAYGPFAPNAAGEPFLAAIETEKDFVLMRGLGATVAHVYDVPPAWMLDLAQKTGIKLLVNVPWNKHLCFLDSDEQVRAAQNAVRTAAAACASHPAVFALSVVNEIPPDIVRWSGERAVAEFIDELIEIAKAEAPDCLCTFGNFPPTEYLRAQAVDFHCFNVYLHHQKAFGMYLSRLQMTANAKPLIVGEFGIDSIRETEERKCEMLHWGIETAFRAGLAGISIFSFTDAWFKEGAPVEDWCFGLTTANRAPKPSFEVVARQFAAAPYFPLPRVPFVSVVVASFNGARTLGACLESLERLNYPSFEILLVDDGSTDPTAAVAARFSKVEVIEHAENLGLSAARNTGVQVARGEIVAFTDSDCRADEDWLHYLIGDLLNSDFVGIGGHNLLPAEDSWVAAAVMASPGGPTHVMLTDRVAEHIPGCNMAFFKWALDEIDGFDPLFRKAGDDVDICWRLQQNGYQIGFSPSGFVWHYRRSTVGQYLRQQAGYGESEALLVHRHPEYFNWLGASQWRGRIYSPARFGVSLRRPVVYHGTFGSGYFQRIYTGPPALALMLVTTLEYHVLVTIPLFVVGIVFRPLLPLAFASLVMSLAVCGMASAQAEVPKPKTRVWSGPLVAVLFFLQPIARGWARYKGRLTVRRESLTSYENLATLSKAHSSAKFHVVQYWSERAIDRVRFASIILRRLNRRGWQNKPDSGWTDYDIEIHGSRWNYLRIVTATETYGSRNHVIRCRLQAGWTFLSRLAFWSLCGIELVLLGFFARSQPWLWLILLTLPAVDWWLTKEQRDLRRVTAVFLDELAAEVGLTKLGPVGTSGPPSPPAPKISGPAE